MEQWKTIRDFGGLYEVSSTGKVRNSSGKEIKQTIRGRGYLGVCLHKDGKQFQRYTHRLVAEAFIDNPLGYSCINHKDENKKNNEVSNLEWCDFKYNNSYGTRLERIDKRLKGKKLAPETCRKMSKTRTGKNRKGKKVICIETKEVFESAREASRKLGLYNGMVAQVCRGRNETAGGYHWKYL